MSVWALCIRTDVFVRWICAETMKSTAEIPIQATSAITSTMTAGLLWNASAAPLLTAAPVGTTGTMAPNETTTNSHPSAAS